jgi:hypothetical protein
MLKKLLTFSTLTLSLNVVSVDDISQFNKRPSLNLNQEYSFDNQAIASKIFTRSCLKILEKNLLTSQDP